MPLRKEDYRDLIERLDIADEHLKRALKEVPPPLGQVKEAQIQIKAIRQLLEDIQTLKPKARRR